ncbi:ABC transporter ATP-binding protein [Pseudodesulfovibrio sediminis]|uniref:ABC transporter ATP-binding protein n=1 Tax=Pseudodesulfovibrio sediminis TaxID=2810563 RepID=A0ABN6EW96_9BACT|nr:ATP-binding cassette domain-containing protein [Pseudodesulfovibrio sediminis]BCS89827.1 ABC transporter ATP-binding protein [Pseudodesulfovibrio sediminis]
MLKAENVSFGYDNGPLILDGINFTINPGEVVGLPGPSGQGKSTLAKLLAGYLYPQNGKVTYNHRALPTNVFNPVQLLFQHPELAINPRWKLRQVIAEGHTPDADTLDTLNIDQRWLSRYPHELSGGELQRLALARAMTPDTCYLIADEMTAMLDPNTQALIWDTVLGWARSRNVGILAISHDRHLLHRIADRIDTLFAPDTVPENSKQPMRTAA